MRKFLRSLTPYGAVLFGLAVGLGIFTAGAVSYALTH